MRLFEFVSLNKDFLHRCGPTVATLETIFVSDVDALRDAVMSKQVISTTLETD